MLAQAFDGTAMNGAARVQLDQNIAFRHRLRNFRERHIDPGPSPVGAGGRQGRVAADQFDQPLVEWRAGRLLQGGRLGPYGGWVRDPSRGDDILAVLFERWIAQRRPVAAIPMLRDAAAVSVVAVVVDYAATPKRFTPGWEFVLSKRSMAVAYAAMALGLAAGALFTQQVGRPTAWEPRR